MPFDNFASAWVQVLRDEQHHEHQDRREQPEASRGSDSSSDPSEEVLDDPTNIALSQRPPAHLQPGQRLAPHGDPLLVAAHNAQQQASDKDDVLPVRSLPDKQGQWFQKRGRPNGAFTSLYSSC